MRKHLEYIEFLRGIAALSVMLFHFICFSPEPNGFVVQSESIRNASVHGALGVQLFYIISGFVITYSLRHKSYHVSQFARYLWKRCIRILPTYWVVIGLILLSQYALITFLWGGVYDLHVKQTLANCFFIVDLIPGYAWINPVFKTLGVEMQFYLLIGLIFPWMDQSWKSFAWIGAGLLVINFFLLGTDNVFTNLPYFLLGYLLMDLREKGSIPSAVFLLLVLVFLAVFYPLPNLLVACLAVLLIHFLRFDHKIGNQIGKVSYSLYLSHGLFGVLPMHFLYYTSFFNNHPFWLIASVTLTSLLAAHLLYFLVEKPSIRFGKRF